MEEKEIIQEEIKPVEPVQEEVKEVKESVEPELPAGCVKAY